MQICIFINKIDGVHFKQRFDLFVKTYYEYSTFGYFIYLYLLYVYTLHIFAFLNFA